MDKKAILSRSPLYQNADPQLREIMENNALITRLETGSYYIHEGDTVENFAIVGEGQLRVFKSGSTGREITLYTVNPGESCLLNIASIMGGTPSPATAQATITVQAVLFPAATIKHWVAEFPAVRDFIFGTLATRVSAMMALVEEVIFRNVDRRLAAFLVERAEGRPGVLPSVSMTHEQIASELGSAREVVSRLLKEFERQGAVKLRRGRIVVVDSDILQ